MLMYGLADEQLVFFAATITGTYKPKIENLRFAKVSISGGVLSEQQVVAQLKRLMPLDHFVWEVSAVEENVFKV